MAEPSWKALVNPEVGRLKFTVAHLHVSRRSEITASTCTSADEEVAAELSAVFG